MIRNNTWTLPFEVKGFLLAETKSFVELVQVWGFLAYFVIYQTWFVAVYSFSSWRYFPRLLPTSFCKLDVLQTRNMPLDLQSWKYKLTPFEGQVQKVQFFWYFSLFQPFTQFKGRNTKNVWYMPTCVTASREIFLPQ